MGSQSFAQPSSLVPVVLDVIVAEIVLIVSEIELDVDRNGMIVACGEIVRTQKKN